MRFLTTLFAGALCLTAVLQPETRPRVYFGELSPEGAAAPSPTAEIEELYKRMRGDAEKREEVQKVFVVAGDPQHADVLVSILERRVRVTGMDYRRSADRRGGGADRGSGRTENELIARLAVPAAHVKLTLDGSNGAGKPLSFEQLACNIVSQAAAWITENQETLRAVKTPLTPSPR